MRKGREIEKRERKKKWETTTKKRVVGKWASELTVLLLQVSSSFVCVQSGLFFFWFWRRTSKKRAKRTTHKTKRVNQKIIQKKTCKAQRVSTENGLLVSYLRSRGLLSPKQTKNKQKQTKKNGQEHKATIAIVRFIGYITLCSFRFLFFCFCFFLLFWCWGLFLFLLWCVVSTWTSYVLQSQLVGLIQCGGPFVFAWVLAGVLWLTSLRVGCSLLCRFLQECEKNPLVIKNTLNPDTDCASFVCLVGGWGVWHFGRKQKKGKKKNQIEKWIKDSNTCLKQLNKILYKKPA